MSKGNKIVGIRIDPTLIEKIDACLDQSKRDEFGQVQSISSWIRSAIISKLAHVKRSKKSSQTPKVRCCHCQKTIRREDVSTTAQRLDGLTDYVCNACDK